MEMMTALSALNALGQPTRLAVFRALVQAGPDGLAAGAIATALEIRPSSLSPHLAVLEQSGLIAAERQGRIIRYRADMAQFSALVGWLTRDCCAGRPDLCAPLQPPAC